MVCTAPYTAHNKTVQAINFLLLHSCRLGGGGGGGQLPCTFGILQSTVLAIVNKIFENECPALRFTQDMRGTAMCSVGLPPVLTIHLPLPSRLSSAYVLPHRMLTSYASCLQFHEAFETDLCPSHLKIVTQKLGILVYWGSILRIQKI